MTIILIVSQTEPPHSLASAAFTSPSMTIVLMVNQSEPPTQPHLCRLHFAEPAHICAALGDAHSSNTAGAQVLCVPRGDLDRT
eukprot:scaffold71408_cov19-Tisochrysis_lutea.AAC.1